MHTAIQDLETNFTLNELAKASSAERNMSGPFRMEHFDYGNTVILEQMMENWNSTAFRGITVRDCYLLSLCDCHQPIFFSLLFFTTITSNTYLYTNTFNNTSA